MIIDYSAADLFGLFQKLLPRGRAWPRDPDAVQTQALAPLMPSYARLLARDNNLVRDSFPATTVELLPEWELSLGLPDPCSGEDPTIASRQAHVVARFSYSGGQSVPYFVGYAAALGFEIEVEEFIPARYGIARYGTPYYGRDWAYVWRVHAPAITVTPARYGEARWTDPYNLWASTVLPCELNRIKPAHTVLLFSYS